jgi:GMP synthase-like glutamine amidotransferase
MIFLFVVVCVGVALLVFVSMRVKREMPVNGLLVDLEFGESNPARHTELRDVLTRKLGANVPSLRNLKVTLDYVHYSGNLKEALESPDLDFVLLSPQGTPWYMYQGDAGRHLEVLKGYLRETVLRKRMPVLGICGGHQFLVLAFGGSVGFIDPALNGKRPERYPRDAVAERGEVVIETLAEDPIFAGLTRHPGSFRAMESHYEEVKTVPQPFINLARSEKSEAQLIRVPGLPVYGFAFHAERGWDQEHGWTREPMGGRQVLTNFMGMVLARKGF